MKYPQQTNSVHLMTSRQKVQRPNNSNSTTNINNSWSWYIAECRNCCALSLFFSMAQQPKVGHGLPIIEGSRSRSDKPNTVGFLWTSDRSGAQTSSWQHKIVTRDIHVPGSIRTYNPSNRAAADRAATEICYLPVFLSLFIVNVSHQCLRFETPSG